MKTDELRGLFSGNQPWCLLGTDSIPTHPLFLPGSFNPLHQGHCGLLKAAEALSGRSGLFELSILNVEKPPLSFEDVSQRILAIQKVAPLVLTRAPTFLEKATLFPESWFVLGFDTAVRLLNPTFHKNIEETLAFFVASKTRFMVAGRLCAGRFLTLKDLHIPEGFEMLFIPIPAPDFRKDISSTRLRSTK